MKQKSKQTPTPKLRFPEFRDGPEWEERRFCDLYRFKPTNSLSRDKLNYDAGDVKIIHYGDIHVRFPERFEVDKLRVPFVNLSESLGKIDSDSYCREGDIIFADASEDLADIGKSIEIVALANTLLLSGTHTILARQKALRLIVGFGAYLFRSTRIRDQIKREAQGSKVFGISPSRLSKISVCLPPEHTEQKKIADCLSSLDEVIAAQAQKVEALSTHKHGLMQRLFPRKGETLPRLRFPEYRDSPAWERYELSSLTTKIGSGITPRGGDHNYQPSGRPFVRSQNVGWGVLLLDDVAHIDQKTHCTFASTEIAHSDVLLNITGASIGRSAVADARVVGGNVNQHVCVIRAKNDVLNPAFLNQFLMSDLGQTQIDSFQAGGNRQGLNFAQIRSFLIPLPPTEGEQKQIADLLTTLDVRIAAQIEIVRHLKTQKAGLMQQLFPSPEDSEA
jgi:type I restriction enzyme S subunit